MPGSAETTAGGQPLTDIGIEDEDSKSSVRTIALDRILVRHPADRLAIFTAAIRLRGILVRSIGIIGLGGVSSFFADAIRAAPDLALAAVCDIDRRRLERWRDATGVATYANPSALLADTDIDAVIVCTPVGTHLELAERALRAGKHVCCEKPLALTREEARKALRVAESLGLTLFTAFHRRYNANLPASGSLSLADVREVEVRYLERIEEHSAGEAWYATGARDGGGAIVDNGPNAFDVLRHLFGEVSVSHVDVRRSSRGVDMAAEIVGGVADGTPARIRLDWAYDGEVKDLVLYRRDGTISRYDMLAGFTTFKSSLPHEYDGVLAEFGRLASSGQPDPFGYTCTAWLEDVLTHAGTWAP